MYVFSQEFGEIGEQVIFGLYMDSWSIELARMPACWRDVHTYSNDDNDGAMGLMML